MGVVTLPKWLKTRNQKSILIAFSVHTHRFSNRLMCGRVEMLSIDDLERLDQFWMRISVMEHLLAESSSCFCF
jgi:hypothetical protein